MKIQRSKVIRIKKLMLLCFVTIIITFPLLCTLGHLFHLPTFLENGVVRQSTTFEFIKTPPTNMGEILPYQSEEEQEDQQARNVFVGTLPDDLSANIAGGAAGQARTPKPRPMSARVLGGAEDKSDTQPIRPISTTTSVADGGSAVRAASIRSNRGVANVMDGPAVPLKAEIISEEDELHQQHLHPPEPIETLEGGIVGEDDEHELHQPDLKPLSASIESESEAQHRQHSHHQLPSTLPSSSSSSPSRHGRMSQLFLRHQPPPSPSNVVDDDRSHDDPRDPHPLEGGIISEEDELHAQHVQRLEQLQGGIISEEDELHAQHSSAMMMNTVPPSLTPPATNPARPTGVVVEKDIDASTPDSNQPNQPLEGGIISEDDRLHAQHAEKPEQLNGGIISEEDELHAQHSHQETLSVVEPLSASIEGESTELHRSHTSVGVDVADSSVGERTEVGQTDAPANGDTIGQREEQEQTPAVAEQQQQQSIQPSDTPIDVDTEGVIIGGARGDEILGARVNGGAAGVESLGGRVDGGAIADGPVSTSVNPDPTIISGDPTSLVTRAAGTDVDSDGSTIDPTDPSESEVRLEGEVAGGAKGIEILGARVNGGAAGDESLAARVAGGAAGDESLVARVAGGANGNDTLVARVAGGADGDESLGARVDGGAKGEEILAARVAGGAKVGEPLSNYASVGTSKDLTGATVRGGDVNAGAPSVAAPTSDGVSVGEEDQTQPPRTTIPKATSITTASENRGRRRTRPSTPHQSTTTLKKQMPTNKVQPSPTNRMNTRRSTPPLSRVARLVSDRTSSSSNSHVGVPHSNVVRPTPSSSPGSTPRINTIRTPTSRTTTTPQRTQRQTKRQRTTIKRQQE